MLTLLGLALAMGTTFHLGGEFEKGKLEYLCDNTGRIELAYHEWECKKSDELEWIKSLKRDKRWPKKKTQ